ncbi:ABC transporter permease subunit [Sinorhizobium meliloti]|nr:ABC transporter permease subunit [Sinorhizobium meliloti]MDW9916935.1 ABC transporter permease subunit [Sinorhizobium meliloti]MDW9948281.1 ABC transporter permease subunit [Sinorhizobium meliloti]
MTIEAESTLPVAIEPEEKHHHESYSALVWRRLKRSWTGLLGLVLVCLLILMAVFAEFLSPVDPKATDVAFAQPQTISFRDKEGNFVFPPRSYPVRETEELDPVTFQPIIGPDYDNPQVLGFFVKGAPYRLFGLIPAERHLFGAVDGTPVHLLGTDKFGRDVLSRILYGSRISLMIALTVVFIVTVVGTTVGMVSGYFGGRFDAWVQRFVELVLAFPQLPLYLALASLIPVTAPTNVFLAFVIIVMSALGWAQMSREVRGKTLALARIEYVRAAIAIGATDRRIIFQHIFPNVMSHVIVAVTLAIPHVVLLESFLGFLGFAVKPPLISWGLMLQDTANYSAIGSYPWILSPVAFVLVTVFAFNALGDGLRDAIDPC